MPHTIFTHRLFRTKSNYYYLGFTAIHWWGKMTHIYRGKLLRNCSISPFIGRRYAGKTQSSVRNEVRHWALTKMEGPLLKAAPEMVHEKSMAIWCIFLGVWEAFGEHEPLEMGCQNCTRRKGVADMHTASFCSQSQVLPMQVPFHSHSARIRSLKAKEKTTTMETLEYNLWKLSCDTKAKWFDCHNYLRC